MQLKKGKITVRHYLNKRAKAKISGGENYYPVYVQIIASGQKAQLKSKISDFIAIYKAYIEKIFSDPEQIKFVMQGYYTESLVKKIGTEKIFPFNNLLTDEVFLITRILKNCQLYSSIRLTLSNFSPIYELHLKDLYQILDEYVKAFYINELNRIFMQSSKSEGTRKLFKISNYLIHFINWTNSFCDYNENTYEILPSEIKLLENDLSEDMKKEIKALHSFRTSNISLMRYLDKTAKGRFPDTNYIDWIEEGKDFISREFTKIFGRQKALEYISSLDKILIKEIKASYNH